MLAVCSALLTALPAAAGHLRGAAGAPAAYSTQRIAIDADGNFNDPDDWAASPAGLAMLAVAGKRGRLVHYSYNNSLGATANDRYFYNQMSHSIDRAVELYGFSRDVFFDAQTRLGAAIENLRQQIDRSSDRDRLVIIAKGPMELIHRALVRSSASRRAYVTVVSHSPWNNTRVWPPSMTKTWRDVQQTGVRWQGIRDQNDLLYPRRRVAGQPPIPLWEPWSWMRDSRDYRLRFIYWRMQAAGKSDISDAGMVYYLLRNDQDASPAKLRQLFAGWN